MSLFSILLIAYSPYLAFLPMAFMGFQVMQKGGFIIKNVWNMGLLFLFIWSFFVGTINMNPVSAVASIGILFYLFVSIYLQNFYNDEKRVEKLLNNVLLVSTGSAFIGLMEGIYKIQYQSSWWKELFGIYPQVVFSEVDRISGTFGNPNVAATWYAAMVLISFHFFIKASGRKKIAFGLGIILFGSVLAMTQSRGAVIGLLMGLIVHAYFSGHKRNAVILSLVLVSGMILMFIFPNWFPRGNILMDSIKDRTEIWQNAINMFKLKPVTGWGLLGIYYASSDVYHYIRTFHAHNIWITIMTTMGLVGLGAFVYMQRNTFDELKVLERNQCSLAPLLAGIQAIIIGQGLTDFTIMNPQGGIIFFGCSAIISALALQYENVAVEIYYSLPVLTRIKEAKKSPF